VLTGAHDEQRLRADGATHVLASVAELPAVLAR
jgi:phosphoglycolate phosphatase-like HAD superfamily hydrolase